VNFRYHLLEDGVNVVTPEPLSWDGGGARLLEALMALKEDPRKAARIAAAGHELARRALRPDNVRR
jgi:hypothetical protein